MITEHTLKAREFASRLIQHEIDHLNGILFIDKAKYIEEIMPPSMNVEAGTKVKKSKNV